MKLAIMQPYFLPYIGYFQLLNAVDEFVVYDNIQYTKRGWIRRNRILVDGEASIFSLPLKKGSDYLDIDQRQLADTFGTTRSKTLRRIEGAYQGAPFFSDAMPVVDRCFGHEDRNLFAFIHHSLIVVAGYLGITTTITRSSDLRSDRSRRGQDRVLSICREKSADHYINAINGQGLYDAESFAREGISLSFMKSDLIEYSQFGKEFVSSLSIIDVMMFNSVETIRSYLEAYTLV